MRHEPGNWCLITALPPQQPTVVVGLGGKPERLLNAEEVKKRPVPVVRRFTGGGTVVVNGGVVVTSLIVDKGCEACAPFPRDIMKWTSCVPWTAVALARAAGRRRRRAGHGGAARRRRDETRRHSK